MFDKTKAIETNQKLAVIEIRNIARNQLHYFKEDGSFVDFDTMPTPSGTHYSYDLKVSDSGFQIWATPRKYGVTGNESYYFDSKTKKIYGNDKKGQKADSNDPLVDKIEDKAFESLNKNR